jgi:hypothetical protein
MIASPTSYSSRVELFLDLQTQLLPVAQVGPDYCLLREPIALPPQNAEMVVIVDGQASRSLIYLTRGATVASRRIDFTPVE